MSDPITPLTPLRRPLRRLSDPITPPLRRATLDNAAGPEDMNAPNWRLHELSGSLAGHWSVWVNGNWRLTFRFDGKDAELVDYQDYH